VSGADGVFLAGEAFLVDGQMVDDALLSTASTCIQTMRSSTEPEGTCGPVFWLKRAIVT